MTITAGKRDRRLRIWKRTETVGTSGEPVLTYVDNGLLHAQVFSISTNEKMLNNHAYLAAEYKANTLYSDRVSRDDRIELDGIMYEITGFDIFGRKEGLTLLLSRKPGEENG